MDDVLNLAQELKAERQADTKAVTLESKEKRVCEKCINKTALYEKVKTYFMNGRSHVNKYQYPFSIDGSAICDSRHPPYMVILCLSQPKHVSIRETIRRTWGSAIRSGQWPSGKHSSTRISGVKLVFVLGETFSETDRKILQQESRVYGDIIKSDFTDSYRNLTMKVMLGMKWATQYCHGFKYLMKTDEDTFVNIRNALLYLKSLPTDNKGVIIGSLNNNSKVIRNGKWHTSSKEYPFNYYPEYISGQTYIISGNLVPKLIHTAEYLPYFYLEDVFITGIVRVIAGANYINEKSRFPRQFDRVPGICQFVRMTRISATNVNNQQKQAIWHLLRNTHRKC
ncbi:hypothetical protein ACF0H5_022128 [Mactra antiquata]